MNKEISDHNLLQIDQAAIGCISGTLNEWPELDHALKKYNITLPHDTIAITLQRICQLLLKNKWQKDLPDSEGDWLFVIMWECGCCVQDVGFVDIIKHDGEQETYEQYIVQERILLSNGLWLSWEPEPSMWKYLKKKNKNLTLNDMDITAWQKITLPVNVAPHESNLTQSD